MIPILGPMILGATLHKYLEEEYVGISLEKCLN